jgi:hypothetical protein
VLDGWLSSLSGAGADFGTMGGRGGPGPSVSSASRYSYWLPSRRSGSASQRSSKSDQIRWARLGSDHEAASLPCVVMSSA